MATSTNVQENLIVDLNKHKKIQKIHEHWTVDETKKYLHLVSIYNQNWKIISSLLPNKTYEQCKVKWRSANPLLNKDKMSEYEIILLRNLVVKHNHNWILISKAFNMRSRIFLRNFWARYKKKIRRKYQIDLEDVILLLSLEYPHCY